ncbi:hypothetical protein [Desulfococcus sp.]|uniref:hypothetical protein n=1 Tax=Desulfococcus sp. TaxID=2025834 RepID=UPI003D0C0391
MKIPNISSLKVQRSEVAGILIAMVCLFLTLSFNVNAAAQNVDKPDKRQDVYTIDRLDEKAVPAQKRQEWNTLKRKLAVEYTDCAEDCGQGEDCQDRCWDVYNFRLDREYQRMIYEGAP